jgi:hypothetical protein
MLSIEKTRLICIRALSAILLVGGRERLAAQTVELGVSFGWYQPAWDFWPGPWGATNLPQHSMDLSGIAWGGEARVRLNDRVAIGAIFTTATSTVPGCMCPGGHDLPPTGERVNLAAAVGLFRLPIGTSSEVSLGLGPAMIQHGGEGYGSYGSPTSWGRAGVIEASHRLVSHLDGVARVLALRYWFNFEPERGPQLDLVTSVGLRWRFRDAPSRRR